MTLLRNFDLRHNTGVVFFTLICGLLGARHLGAQAQTATVLGTVTDMSGAVIAEASVDARNAGTGVTQNVLSNAQGRYQVSDLAIGDYILTATKPGFQTVVRPGITLSVGQSSVVDFSLPVGQAQQTVTVESQISQVETTTSTVSSLVDQRQIQELPLNGRDLQQLIYTAPGVSQYTGMSTGAFRGGNAPGYSISGSRPIGQVEIIDNQNVQNFWTTGMGAITLGTSLGVESIQEFNVLTGVYGTQFSGTGGVMNIVTKSGTNAFHGTAYDYLRNNVLDAKNFFASGINPPFRKNQFGGTLGGPIKKDKAFFFVNYEGLRQLLSETKVANVPDANAHNGYLPCASAKTYACNGGLAFVGVSPAVANTLSDFPLPTSALSGGVGYLIENGNQIASEDYFVGRFDYIFSPKDSFSIRYIMDRADLFEPFPNSSLPIWTEADTTRNQFATIEERRIVSVKTVNLLRFSFSRPSSTGTPKGGASGFSYFPDRQNGSITIPGITATGPISQAPYVLTINRFNVGDDVIMNLGSHSLRFGVSITKRDTNTLNWFRWGGSWTFPSLLAFLTDSPSLLAGVLPGTQYPNRDLRELQLMPYISDEWKVRPNLTLNFGLRYEFVTNPVDAHNQLYEIVDPQSGNAFTHVPHLFQNGNPTAKNLDPRVGFAWDPFSDHKTSFRGGFGVYDDLIVYTYFPSLWSSPPERSGTQTNPTSYPVPFTSVTPSPLQDSPGFDYRINHNPYMMQWNFNVQRQLMANTVLSVGYQGSRGVHLMTTVDQNPVVPTCCVDGRLVFGNVIGGKLVPNARIDPAYSYLGDANAIASSNYNGLQVGLTRRQTPHLTYEFAYTYAHSLDNGSAYSNGEASNNGGNQNPYNYRADYSNSSFDVRQSLRVNAVYLFPFRGNRLIEGWQLSGIQTYQTGLPFTVQNGFDQMGDTTTGRPDWNPSCTHLIIGSPNQWFNPSCFLPPPIGLPAISTGPP